MLWRGQLVAITICLCLLAGGNPGHAQQLGLIQSPILTVEPDRLFSGSRFGQRIAQEREAEAAVLAAENRRIASELEREEQQLTERRDSMEPDAFRILADAFDEKVQQIRREQDAKELALNDRVEGDRVEFLQAAAPVLERLMRDAGAAVILDRGTVFISLNATDVTDLAIARIDAAIGDGSTTLDE